MATNWSNTQSPTNSPSTKGGSVTLSSSPSNGDMLIAFIQQHFTGGSFSGAGACAMSDNGTNTGWNTLLSPVTDITSTGTAAYYKICAAGDTSMTTVTFTVTGPTTGVSCELLVNGFRVSGGTINGVDLNANTFSSTSATTKSWSPASGSSQPSNTDELAVTYLYSTQSISQSITGTNHFVGTSAAANLATLTATSNVFPQWVGGVQASATAGTNVWENTWSTSSGYIVLGLTFYYTATTSYPPTGSQHTGRIRGMLPRGRGRSVQYFPYNQCGINFLATLLNDLDPTTNAFTPLNVGDCIVLSLFSEAVSGAISAASITSTNATWVRGVTESPVYSGDPSGECLEIWVGTVTSTTSSVLTITWNGTLDLCVSFIQEFTTIPSLGKNAVWAPVVSNSNFGSPGVGANPVPMPPMTSPSNCDLIYYFIDCGNTASLASTVPGFTVFLTPGDSVLAYNVDSLANTTYSPSVNVVGLAEAWIGGGVIIQVSSQFLNFRNQQPAPSKRASVRGRGRTPTVVPAQVVLPNPAIVLKQQARAKLVAASFRRRFDTSFPLANTPAPIIRRQARLAALSKIRLIQYPFPASTIPATGYPEIIFVDGHPALHVAGLWYTLIG